MTHFALISHPFLSQAEAEVKVVYKLKSRRNLKVLKCRETTLIAMMKLRMEALIWTTGTEATMEVALRYSFFMAKVWVVSYVVATVQYVPVQFSVYLNEGDTTVSSSF